MSVCVVLQRTRIVSLGNIYNKFLPTLPYKKTNRFHFWFSLLSFLYLCFFHTFFLSVILPFPSAPIKPSKVWCVKSSFHLWAFGAHSDIQQLIWLTTQFLVHPVACALHKGSLNCVAAATYVAIIYNFTSQCLNSGGVASRSSQACILGRRLESGG
jgi:hypothetical protein